MGRLEMAHHSWLDVKQHIIMIIFCRKQSRERKKFDRGRFRKMILHFCKTSLLTAEL